MLLFERIQRVRAARRHTTAGLEAYARGDLTEAEADFVSALWFAAGLGTTDDTARRAYINLAVVYIENGKYHEGRQLLRQALATGMTETAPSSWEPVPLWGFDRDAGDAEAVGRLVAGVRRALRKESLNPAPALRSLALFEQGSDRSQSASLLVTLADSI